MLTLYIMKTHHDDKKFIDAHLFLRGLYSSVVLVGNTDEINNSEKKDDWYLVLFDNELMNEDLREAIYSLIDMDTDIDVFVLMKKNGDKYAQSPRLFRKNVILQSNSFLPEDKSLKFERILNGWIT